MRIDEMKSHVTIIVPVGVVTLLVGLGAVLFVLNGHSAEHAGELEDSAVTNASERDSENMESDGDDGGPPGQARPEGHESEEHGPQLGAGPAADQQQQPTAGKDGTIEDPEVQERHNENKGRHSGSSHSHHNLDEDWDHVLKLCRLHAFVCPVGATELQDHASVAPAPGGTSDDQLPVGKPHEGRLSPGGFDAWNHGGRDLRRRSGGKHVRIPQVTAPNDDASAHDLEHGHHAHHNAVTIHMIERALLDLKSRLTAEKRLSLNSAGTERDLAPGEDPDGKDGPLRVGSRSLHH